jgi:hypothetical protein
MLTFIELYRGKPVLWDQTHHKPYNKCTNTHTWEELPKAVGIPVDDCKKKINSLLSSLRRGCNEG